MMQMQNIHNEVNVGLSFIYTKTVIFNLFQWVDRWETYNNSCTNELCAICVMILLYVTIHVHDLIFFQWISTNQRLFLYMYILFGILGWNLQNKPLHTICIQ